MRLSLFLAFSVCFALCGTRLLFPSEVSFNTDERQLLTRAWEQNRDHSWTTHGLRGTRGLDYGPVPTLLYRGGLMLTESLPSLVVIKATAISLLSLWAVFALLWFCPWIAPSAGLAFFLSPYFWIYARDLWDNSWNIPLTGLCFAFYLGFVNNHKRRWLLACALSAIAALQTHLLCLPLLAAIAWNFANYKTGWARKNRAFLFALLTLCLALLFPYAWHILSTSQTPVTIKPGPGILHFVFGFLGPRLFSGIGLEYFLGPFWYTALPLGGLGIGAIAMGLTSLVMVAFVVGLRDVWNERRSSQDKTRRAAADVCFSALVLHTLLVGAQQLINHPHYYGSIWVAYFYTLSLGASKRLNGRNWNVAASLYFVAMGICLSLFILQIHGGQGLESPHYGKPLGQSEAARALPFSK